MPELPEVESIVRTLKPKLLGTTISSATIYEKLSIQEPDQNAFSQLISGKAVQDLTRRGKYLLFILSDGWYLLTHLRMTGQLIVTVGNAEAPRFARVALHLNNNHILWFADMRKFGRLTLTRNPDAILGQLGPEPLSQELNQERLHSLMQGKKRPIKSFLLDQRAIAGLGNIYADEALHLARIHPLRKTASLTLEEATKLLEAIHTVLQKGIANRGTTIATYRTADGQPGSNQESLQVYGRKGYPCFTCGTPITGVRLSGRSTCYCPTCQQEDGQSANSS